MKFETNLDTVHRLACWKRDQERDFSDFEKLRQSELYKRVYDECQERVIRRAGIGLWWAPHRVTLFDDGEVEVSVCWAEHHEATNERKWRFAIIGFTFCQSEEVSQRVADEKQRLNFWYEPGEAGKGQERESSVA